MRRNRFTRSLSLLLVVLMMMSFMPTSVGTAQDNGTEQMVLQEGETVTITVRRNDDGFVLINGVEVGHNQTYQVPLNSEVVFEAVPVNPRKIFKNWLSDENQLKNKTSNPITITATKDFWINLKFGFGEGVTVYTAIFDPGDHGVLADDYLAVQEVESGAYASDPGIAEDPGWIFTGWSPDDPAVYPINQNTTFTAQYAPATDTLYKVEHYQENLTKDGYVLYETENLTGTTGTTVNATAKIYSGFTQDPGAAGTIASGTVAADGSLVLKLYYTRDTYTVDFDANGGSPEPTDQDVNFGALITEPADPTMAGYLFDDWYNGTDLWDFATDTMPDSDITLRANWSPATDTAYTVRHHLEDLNADTYTLEESETLHGTTGQDTAASANTYPGFTAGTVTQETISADGTTVVDIYYARNLYTITFDSAGGSSVANLTLEYEALVTAPADPIKAGYNFGGWTPALPATMPVDGAAVIAQWTPMEYTITYMLDGGTNYESAPVSYTIETPTITFGEPAKTGHTFADWYDAAEGGNVVTELPLGSTGDITLYARWTVNPYTVTYRIVGEYFAVDTYDSQTYDFGAAVTAVSAPVQSGYIFSGWTGVPATMPAYDVIVTGSFTPNDDTTYIVEHYQENLAKDAFVLFETENLTGTTDATVNGTAKIYTGFTYDPNVAGTVASGTVAADGSLVLKLYYTRNVYAVTFVSGDNGVLTNGGLAVQSVPYGGAAQDPGITPDSGFNYTGWNGSFSNITGNLTVTAQYTPITLVVTVTETIDGETTTRTVPYAYGASVTPENLGIEEVDGYTYETSIDLPFNITTNQGITVNYTLIPVGEPEPTPTLTPAPTPEEPEIIVYEETPEAPAEEEPEVIVDEETPEAPVEDGFNWWWLLLLLLPFLFFLLWWNRVVPVVEGVTDNRNGTYTVTWGYNNRKIKDVKYDKEDSEVHLLAGNILRGEEPPVEFERGRHENVFTTIVDQSAKVEWNIKRKKALADVLEQLKKGN